MVYIRPGSRLILFSIPDMGAPHGEAARGAEKLGYSLVTRLVDEPSPEGIVRNDGQSFRKRGCFCEYSWNHEFVIFIYVSPPISNPEPLPGLRKKARQLRT